MFEFAKKESKISQEVLAILEQSIKADIARQTQETVSQDALKDTLNEV